MGKSADSGFYAVVRMFFLYDMAVKSFISQKQNSLLNRNWRCIFGVIAGISVFSRTVRIDSTTFQSICVI